MSESKPYFPSTRIFINLVFVCAFLYFNLIAQTPVAGADDSGLSVDFRDNLVSIHANDINFKDILSALNNKTGVNVVIFPGVPDRKVSLDIQSLPLHALDTIIKKMSLKNSAVVYDDARRMMSIYVLPEGLDISKVVGAGTVVRSADFAAVENVSTIKGKEFVTLEKGKNKLPIRYVKDELLLKFHLGVTEKEINSILQEYNLQRLPTPALSKIGYVKVKVPKDKDAIETAKSIRKDYRVKVPEPNYIANILTVADPLYDRQWYVPDTHFDKAWPLLKNKAEVTVAVIDTGVDSLHPDLNGKLFQGKNFVNNDADPFDDNGHGTFVTGIVAANANDMGIKGLYEGARILPVKAIDANGFGTYEDVAAGIIYAADQGARVINMSIGGYAYSFMLQDAVDYALEKGCIVVAAGGNDGIDQKMYPAAYPDVIGVSALGYNGEIWPDSNSGSHIDVSAPGVDVLSTGFGKSYVSASGTSASAPMVAALAAMLVSEKPDLSNAFIRRLIIQSAEDLGEKRFDRIYGGGEIDACAALKEKVKSFHDVMVERINVEPYVLEENQPVYICVDVGNVGSFKEEQVALKVFINDELIDTVQKTRIQDRLTVVVPWNFVPSSEERLIIKAFVESVRDIDEKNNTKKRALEYVKNDAGLHTLHHIDPGIHQWIAGEAFYEWPNDTNHEIYDYIGSPIYSRTYDGHTYTNYSEGYEIIMGARDEDTSTNPFGDSGNWWDSTFTCKKHFWNRGEELEWYEGGYDGEDSAVNRAYKYWTGGYGLDNTYDGAWDNGYGVQGQGVLYCFQHNQKALAYEYLGHIVHLLTDMSVPAHVLDDPHGGLVIGDDNFEDFMAEFNESVAPNTFVFKRYGNHGLNSVSGDPTDYTGYTGTGTSSGLYKIFYDTAETADDYESDAKDGGIDDNPDGEVHNDALGDVPPTECAVHQEALQPYVIKQVAALYKWFWNETHGTLSVSTSPSGEIYVNGSYKGTGSWSGSVETGSYTVSFGSLSGYITPAPQTVTVNAGQSTTVAVTYTTATDPESKIVILTADKDTYVKEGNPTLNFGSSTTLRVTSDTLDNYGLINFNFDDIPSGSVINGVQLQLYCSYYDGSQICISESDSYWSESTVTWDTKPIQGYEYGFFHDVTGIGYQQIANPKLTNLVKDWMNGIECNYGIYLYAVNYGDNITFYSSEYSTSSYRPKLIITYTPPPPSDLIITDLYPEPGPSDNNFYVGQSVDWHVTVKNIDSGTAGESSVGYYLGTTSTDLSNKINQDITNSLEFGGTDSDRDSYIFTASDIGVRYLICKADCNEGIEENSETNNTKVYGPFNVAEQNPELSVTPVSHEVNADSGTAIFTVDNTGGGTMPWTASVISGESWLSITSGSSGTDSGTITAAFSANASGSSRTGIIRVAASGADGSPKDVSIIQPSSDTSPTTATLTVSDITAEGLMGYFLKVEYNDDNGINADSIGQGDLRVLGPNFDQLVGEPFIAYSSNTALYPLENPYESWTPEHNGTYYVWIEPNQIQDNNGYYMPAQQLGTFRVDIPEFIGLTIEGPTLVDENSTTQYTATASWSDGTTSTVTPVWSENSPYAHIDNGGLLTAYGILSNESVTITASYSYGGVTKTDTHFVTIVDVVKNLNGLIISGPTLVDENSTTQYTATASWSDGTTSTVTPVWSENSPYASISSSGLLTASSVTSNQSLTITASYCDLIEKTDTHSVTIISTANLFDSDSDGMSDNWEIAYSLDLLTDDSGLDADGDQFTNGREFQDNTDPNNPASHLVLPEATGRLHDTCQNGGYTGTFGEDADYLINPPSYIKMDEQGNYLADSATVWAMVRDNVTGLIWEIKHSSDGVTDYSNPHDADNSYTWYDSNPDTNGGDAGTAGEGRGTQDFINALNAKNFGGASDWRLPTVKELSSLVNSTIGAFQDPAIDAAWFPFMMSSKYWSSTTYADNTSYAWLVDFLISSVYYFDKSNSYYVLAVRGGQEQLSDRLIINGDGTVTDTQTGLMWQAKHSQTTMNWENALDCAENLSVGGYADWRLPNRNELLSIVDYKSYAPAIDTTTFPDELWADFWSSSTGWFANTIYAHIVGFYSGYFFSLDKFSNCYVRAVRGGQNQLSDHLIITSPLQASFWDVGHVMPISWEALDISGNVKISLSRQGGKDGSFETVIESTENDGAHNWTVTGPVSYNCTLKIESVDEPSKGNVQGLFTISDNPNTIPVSNETSFITDEDVAYSGALTGSDDDGDALTYFIVDPPTKGAVEIIDTNTGAFTYTPNLNENGVDCFTFKATDGQAESEPATVSITINPDNDAPAISGIADVAIDEDCVSDAIIFTVSDVESSAGELTVSAVSNNTLLIPEGGIVLGGSAEARSITVTPAADQWGSALITVTVGDGVLSTGTTFTVMVNTVNDAPAVSGIADVVIDEDCASDAIAFTVSDVESFAGELTVSAVSGNPALIPEDGITLGGSAEARSITVTPAADQWGSALITVTVSDGVLIVETTFTVTVNAVNDAPPVISGIPPTQVDQYSAYSFTPESHDVDQNDPLTFSIENKPLWAQFDPTTGTLTGTPGSSDAGITSGIVISVKDSFGATASLPAFDLTVNDIVLKGDIDDNGIIDIGDAILTLQVVNGMSPSDAVHYLADVNDDGKIGIAETVYVLRVISTRE